MDNLYIYNQVREVPREACKQFNNGRFSGTDINPMWRIKTLTEQFGPAGLGWYYEVLSERAERVDDTHMMAIVDLNLYVKHEGEWSKPIYGTGGNMILTQTKSGTQVSDEGYKMALTDAISVACKALGIGANVYWQADRTKYTAAQPQEMPDPAPAQEGDLHTRLRAAVPQPIPGNAQPKPTPRMAAPGQIQFLFENLSDAERELTQKRYGDDLSDLTYEVASRIIAKIQDRQKGA